MNRQVSVRFYSLTVLAVLVGLAAVVLNRPMLAPLAMALAATPALALLSWRWPHVEVDFQLSSARVVEGDELLLVVEVASDTTLSWIDIELDPGAGLESTDRILRRVVSVQADHAVRVAFPIRPTAWGVLEAGRYRLIVRDRLGLFSCSTIGTVPGALRVYPSESRLRGMARPGRTIGVLGAHLSKDRGEGCEYADVRAWQSGDRLRMVNWRVSERRGTTWVTERHPERASDAVIVLDDTAAIGPEDDSTLRRAVQAAMALSEGHLAAQDRVGLLALGAPLRWVRPRAGTRQLYALVDVLLECRLARLSGVSRQEFPVLGGLRPGSTVVALSLLADVRVVGLLAELRRHGHQVAVLEPVGPVAVEGGGSPVSVTDVAARRVWHLERDERREQLMGLGVPVLQWDGVTPLGALLGRGAALGGATLA